MRILFDQGTPVPLKEHLLSHEVKTAFELGWSDLKNGELLAAAEHLFDVFITTDQQIRYQQNLMGRQLAVLVSLNHKLAENQVVYTSNSSCRRDNKAG